MHKKYTTYVQTNTTTTHPNVPEHQPKHNTYRHRKHNTTINLFISHNFTIPEQLNQHATEHPSTHTTNNTPTTQPQPTTKRYCPRPTNTTTLTLPTHPYTQNNNQPILLTNYIAATITSPHLHLSPEHTNIHFPNSIFVPSPFPLFSLILLTYAFFYPNLSNSLHYYTSKSYHH
jgi:hypothetical protein